MPGGLLGGMLKLRFDWDIAQSIKEPPEFLSSSGMKDLCEMYIIYMLTTFHLNIVSFIWKPMHFEFQSYDSA